MSFNEIPPQKKKKKTPRRHIPHYKTFPDFGEEGVVFSFIKGEGGRGGGGVEKVPPNVNYCRPPKGRVFWPKIHRPAPFLWQVTSSPIGARPSGARKRPFLEGGGFAVAPPRPPLKERTNKGHPLIVF